MLRIGLALIAGISMEIGFDYLHLSQQALPTILLLLGVSFITVVGTSLVQNITWVYKLRTLNGIVLSVFVISFGYALTWFYADKNFKTHFQNYTSSETFVVARIVKPPLEKAKIVTVVAKVEEVISKSTTVKTTGNILINVLRDSRSQDLKYGDVIVFNSKIEEFDEPKNPEEFSFKLYQSFHNIYHRTFLKTGDWKLVASNQGNVLMAKVYHIREYFLSVILKYITDKNDVAVAAAIMLGYNDYMNGDITRAYASSGALHVLSVSGLHVGIMFLMLNFLFSFMDKRGRKYQIAKAIGIIAFIWFYACLTGLSPSVLRSAMMFSMIQFGKVLTKNVNTYNIIFASALLLMLFNPFIITEVGFRLSYLAVIGIIFIQPKISALWVMGIPKEPEFKKQKWFLRPVYFLRYDLYWGFLKVIDLGWQIIAVSIAAQIATCPLSLLYFHQFPNLFLLSNLVVIPVSNLILFIGTALCALGEVAWLNDKIGWCFSHLLWLLNKFIFWIDSIPFALIQGISITMFEMVLLYILIFLLCWLTEERRTKILIASFFIVFGLCSFYSCERITKAQQKKIVVYCTPKQSAIAFIDGKKVLRAFDEKLLNDQSAMMFHVKHHWWDCGVKQEEKIDSKQLVVGKLLHFEGKRVLVVDSALEKTDFVLDKKLKVDLLILSHSPKVYLKNLKKMIEFDEVIFDSSNKKWKIDYWKKDCAEMKIKYWDVSERGAYIKDLNDDALAKL
jgi:competence protein ComEC